MQGVLLLHRRCNRDARLPHESARPGTLCSLRILFYTQTLQQNQGAAIAVCCALIGFFALGVYPLGLELIVECTYPVDQV